MIHQDTTFSCEHVRCNSIPEDLQPYRLVDLEEKTTSMKWPSPPPFKRKIKIKIKNKTKMPETEHPVLYDDFTGSSQAGSYLKTLCTSPHYFCACMLTRQVTSDWSHWHTTCTTHEITAAPQSNTLLNSYFYHNAHTDSDTWDFVQHHIR